MANSSLPTTRSLLDEGRATSRGWKVNRRGKAARHRNVPHPPLISEATRENNVKPLPPCHAVMKFMIPSMLALVTLKYQGKNKSVFEENSVPIWCFVLESVTYWLIVGWMKRAETLHDRCFHVLNRAALASVVLSAASLASIFLSQRITFIPLMVLTPLPVLLLVQQVFYRAYTRIRFEIANFMDRIQGYLTPAEISLSV